MDRVGSCLELIYPLISNLSFNSNVKVKVNLKPYDVTDWTENNYKTYIAQYLKK